MEKNKLKNKMKYYHGTSTQFAKDIQSKGIDCSRGTGELGRGFYVGDYAHVAFAYAWHKYSNEDCSVLECDIKESNFPEMNVITPSKKTIESKIIRARHQNCSLGCDVVMADGVIQDGSNHRQIKFENTKNNCLTIIKRYDVKRQ